MNDNMIENIDGLFEFLNDAVFETIILHLYGNIKDPYFRQFVGNFLLTISDIYMYEFSKFSFIDTSNIKKHNEKLLEELRKNSMKYSFTSDSNHFNEKAFDMGLSYDNTNINDCVIYYDKDKKYMDNNFRMWPYYKENIESKKFFYDLVYNCDLWLKGLLKNSQFDFYSEVMDEIKKLEKPLITELNKNSIKVVSYSVNRLFNGTKFLDNQKGFILNYYGLIKSVLYFEKIFIKTNILIIPGNIKFESKRFFCKLKSICIENIYDYFKNNDSELWNNFFEIINQSIPDSFWKANRSCRRNIHYKDFVKISDKDLECINKFQELYLNKFTMMIEEKLNFNVTFIDKIITIKAKYTKYDRKN